MYAHIFASTSGEAVGDWEGYWSWRCRPRVDWGFTKEVTTMCFVDIVRVA